MKLPWNNGVLLVAIDPAQLVTGIAWSGQDAEGKPLEGTRRFGDILDAAQLGKLLEALKTSCAFTSVRVAVEYPKWNAGASPVVRAAANTYIRLVRSVFGSKVDVVRVDPNEWHRLFGFKDRAASQTTKDFSLHLAERVYGWVCEGQHDRADAALILEWLKCNPVQPRTSAVKRKRKSK